MARPGRTHGLVPRCGRCPFRSSGPPARAARTPGDWATASASLAGFSMANDSRASPRPRNSSTGVPGRSRISTGEPSAICLRFASLVNLSMLQPPRSRPSTTVPAGSVTTSLSQSRPSFAWNS